MREKTYTIPAAAENFIRAVLTRERAVVCDIIRTGPRFFVADVLYRNKRALFKACIHPQSEDLWTNMKFGKEVLFLQYLRDSGHPRVRHFAPHIYAGAAGTRAWYIREYISGVQYNIRGGNIRFRDSFFTKKHRKDIVASFRDLQSIRASQLPRAFARRLARYDTTEHEERLLAPYWGRIAHFLGDRNAKGVLPRILAQRSHIYDHAPGVLAHQEPYASHFIRKEKKLRLIDWENINWTNPVHDFAKLWMRASKHSRWQEDLHKDARRVTAPLLGERFDAVWETSLLIKGLFNILSFPYYKDRADFISLHAISQRIVKNQLRAWRKSHE